MSTVEVLYITEQGGIVQHPEVDGIVQHSEFHDIEKETLLRENAELHAERDDLKTTLENQKGEIGGLFEMIKKLQEKLCRYEVLVAEKAEEVRKLNKSNILLKEKVTYQDIQLTNTKEQLIEALERERTVEQENQSLTILSSIKLESHEIVGEIGSEDEEAANPFEDLLEEYICPEADCGEKFPQFIKLVEHRFTHVNDKGNLLIDSNLSTEITQDQDIVNVANSLDPVGISDDQDISNGEKLDDVDLKSPELDQKQPVQGKDLREKIIMTRGMKRKAGGLPTKQKSYKSLRKSPRKGRKKSQDINEDIKPEKSIEKELKMGSNDIDLKSGDKPKQKAAPIAKVKSELSSVHLCDDCGRMFDSKRTLKRHKASHKDNKELACEICHLKFEVRKELVAHRRVHKEERLYECEQCHVSFHRPGALKNHMTVHSGTKEFQCKECERCFARLSYLNEHQKIHSGEKQYKCSDCGRCFAQAAVLRRHRRIHLPAEDRLHRCYTCDKAYNSHREYLAHMRSHTGDKPFVCRYCDKAFSRAQSRTQHEMIHQGIRPFLCSDCGKRFIRSRDLQIHRRVHTGDKPYQCEFCPRRFASRAHYLSHRPTHTGDKPHLCPICGKRFARLKDCKVHRLVHVTSNPYKCTDCEKCFATEDRLNKHRMLHTGDKKHSCETCGKSFTRASTLFTHRKFHMEKGYKCQECGKAFHLDSDLNKHMLIHSGIKPHHCMECGRNFALKPQLKKHKCLPLIEGELRKTMQKRPRPKIHVIEQESVIEPVPQSDIIELPAQVEEVIIHSAPLIIVGDY